MYGRVFKFNGILSSPAKNFTITGLTSLPIYTDDLEIVGAFSFIDLQRVCGFVAGNGYPLALRVATGQNFFFTPVEDLKGNISSAIVSEMIINDSSIVIKHTEDQSHD